MDSNIVSDTSTEYSEDYLSEIEDQEIIHNNKNNEDISSSEYSYESDDHYIDYSKIDIKIVNDYSKQQKYLLLSRTYNSKFLDLKFINNNKANKNNIDPYADNISNDEPKHFK